jgi:aspartyl-tRNA synthetase
MTALRSIYRTHTCGELRAEHAGENVTLSGWIMRKRDHGGVLFIDLRDNYGVTQVVVSAGALASQAQDTRVESVIRVSGAVKERAAEMKNPKIETGEVEVHATSFELLSAADVLPFQIAEDDKAPETTRLKYRFLDLRRDRVHENILLRSRVIHEIRNLMTAHGFREFQTPILTSSSPEGARDFIVPSRFHPGKFFALPQAPQQFKQLLMVAGFDRYFQIAPCFRDEDPRADRSPGEFYQLDMEMSFVEQEDVFSLSESVMTRLFEKFTTWKVSPAPFPRIPYEEAISKYGSDKPDLRNPLVITTLTDILANSGFQVFQRALAEKGIIAGIVLPCTEVPPRKFFDETVDTYAKASGAGLGYLVFEADGTVKGNISKFISEDERAALRERLKISGLAVLFIAAGAPKNVFLNLGRLRTTLGENFNLLEKDVYRFCWITDFPMFEVDEETGGLTFAHNPFSMPQGGLQALETQDPLTIKAFQYDIVCNGHELSSGAIRNHLPELMYKAFSLVGYSKEVVDDKFGGMIRAFKFGAPPHGGMAPGIDRIVMLLAQESAIRDVIAFPLAQSVEDLLMSAPSTVSERQLKDVHIQVVMPPEPAKN